MLSTEHCHHCRFYHFSLSLSPSLSSILIIELSSAAAVRLISFRSIGISACECVLNYELGVVVMAVALCAARVVLEM